MKLVKMKILYPATFYYKKILTEESNSKSSHVFAKCTAIKMSGYPIMVLHSSPGH